MAEVGAYRIWTGAASTGHLLFTPCGQTLEKTEGQGPAEGQCDFCAGSAGRLDRFRNCPLAVQTCRSEGGQ
ncbi:hypothetical protein D3C84_1138340 [compost metagenome]